MNAEEARRLLETKYPTPFQTCIEHVHRKIAKAARDKRRSLVTPFHGLVWPPITQKLRDQVFAQLKQEGFVVTHHEADKASPSSFPYDEVSW